MKTRTLAALPAAFLLVGCLAGASHAAPLTLRNVSAADAAAQLSDKYGINIVLKGDYGPTPKYVTFTINDADAVGARLEAVNALANAVGADFTKTFVISKATDDTSTPSPRIDSTALMAFPDTKMSAQDAINTVAAADNATAQIVGDLPDTVTLSAPSLTVAHAADEVAQQTHTRWKAFYALTPRDRGHVLNGKVIDRTNGGSPITELPGVYYDRPQPPAPNPNTAQQQALSQADAAAQQQAEANASAQYNALNGPNGYNPYGYNPYGGGYGYGAPYGYGYGYGGPSLYSPGAGLMLQGGSPYGYGGGPIIFTNPGYGYSSGGYGYGGFGNGGFGFGGF